MPGAATRRRQGREVRDAWWASWGLSVDGRWRSPDIGWRRRGAADLRLRLHRSPGLPSTAWARLTAPHRARLLGRAFAVCHARRSSARCRPPRSGDADFGTLAPANLLSGAAALSPGAIQPPHVPGVAGVIDIHCHAHKASRSRWRSPSSRRNAAWAGCCSRPSAPARASTAPAT